MCNSNCVIFGVVNATKSMIEGKDVIEVGSCNVNGSLRKVIELNKPKSYIGVDITEGPGVDKICPADRLVKEFGQNSFDLVISTEMLEHVRDWKTAISNMKNICKPGGYLLLTVPSIGFLFHAYPYDFWRFEPDDVNKILSDLEIVKLEYDKAQYGVMSLAKKPSGFIENNLNNYMLYSMITENRINSLEDTALESFQRRYNRKQLIKDLLKFCRSIIKKAGLV